MNDQKDFEQFSADLYDVYARFPRSTAVLDHVQREFPSTTIQVFKPDKSLAASLQQSYAKKGPLTNVTWNLFFVVTTLTSIGYGTNAPDSLIGRVFCIVYISFGKYFGTFVLVTRLYLGIPLYLLILADLVIYLIRSL